MTLTNEQVLGFFIFGMFMLVGLIAIICTFEAKSKPPKKPNIRVPRETLWGRTQRYHRGQ